MSEQMQRKVVHKETENIGEFLDLIAKEAAAFLFTEQEADWDIRISLPLKGFDIYAYLCLEPFWRSKCLKQSFRVGDLQQDWLISKRNFPYPSEEMIYQIRKMCEYYLYQFLAVIGKGPTNVYA